MQVCRKCKQSHQDHAERHNAYVEAYAQQDEDQVFEDYFQIQVAPCQYLMLLHERAGVCGRAVSTPGWLAAGVSYPEHALRHVHQRMFDTWAESGILAHVWHAILRAAPAGEHHAASVELSKVNGGMTCGMALTARSLPCLSVEKTCDGVVDSEGR